jgi:hypothetical protein
MNNKIISLFFLSFTLLAGCLSQDDMSGDLNENQDDDEGIVKEFADITGFLRKINPDDVDREKSSVPGILKVTKKKFKLLRYLDEDVKFHFLWDETYLAYDQKPRYLKTNPDDDSFFYFDGGQCVDAIYCLTDLKIPVSSWIKGEKVTDTDIEPGTVIATFNDKGKYYGHAAVFKSKKSGYLEVFDQNWWSTDKLGNAIEWTKNIFCTHRIIGSTGQYNPNNMNNYYVVMIK